MAYVIRPFRDDDAPTLAALTQGAIREIGAQAYTDEQVEAWATRHPGAERFLARASAGDHILVAADGEEQAVAYAVLERPEKGAAHLDMLYCHPDHTKRGLADQLLAQCEAAARAEETTRLFTEASELARPAFERAGYDVIHRRDFGINHNGRSVAIHNYAMEKQLAD